MTARPDKYDIAYLDSCVFTTYFLRHDGWERIQRVMDAADAGGFVIVASTFSLVECLGQSPSPHHDVGHESRVRTHLDSPRVQLVEFSRHVALHARELHITKQLDLGDSIHMASAIEAGADVLFTFDTDFPLNSYEAGVWVSEPYLPGDPNLFDPPPEH